MIDTNTERELGGVGTKVLFENDNVRVWELDLAPGESSDIHQHDHDEYSKPRSTRRWS